MVYDTIYAHQDKKDDEKIKLKGLALKWGDRTLEISRIFNLAMFGFLELGGWLNGYSWLYYSSVASATLYNDLRIKIVDLEDGSSCQRYFNSSRYYSAMIGVILLMERLYKLVGEEEKLGEENEEDNLLKS